MGIVEDRRALHRIPELDKDLPETLGYLRGSLAGLGCRVFSPMDGSLCAWFEYGADSAIAFRADMDALPVAEKTGAVYASRNPGKMHACGHDGHMAGLLELARRLDKMETLGRNVLLVFQPAEETTGGARDICETGIFTQYAVEAIFGLHLWPGLAEGTVASRKNELMSRSCEVKVEITGKSAHIAKAEEAIDALAAGVAFYQKARALEAAVPENVFRVLNFGRLESGTVCNVISGRTRLEGSLRAFQDAVFFGLRDGLLEAGRQVEAETGCAVAIHMSDGYPAVMNPAPLYDQIKAIVDFRELEKPSMTAEDFSWYQQYVPGMFFFLGTGDTPALHAANFDFNEEILEKGADLFQRIAENYQ